MPPVRETSHAVCALVNSPWEPQPINSSVEKICKGSQSFGTSAYEVEPMKMTMAWTSGTNTNDCTKSASNNAGASGNCSNTSGSNNPWGPIFKSRENFNEMHFC